MASSSSTQEQQSAAAAATTAPPAASSSDSSAAPAQLLASFAAIFFHVRLDAPLQSLTKAVVPARLEDGVALTPSQQQLWADFRVKIIPTGVHVYKEAGLPSKFGIVKYAMVQIRDAEGEEGATPSSSITVPTLETLWNSFERWATKEHRGFFMSEPTAAALGGGAAGAPTSIAAGITALRLHPVNPGMRRLVKSTPLVTGCSDERKMATFLCAKLLQQVAADSKDVSAKAAALGIEETLDEALDAATTTAPSPTSSVDPVTEYLWPLRLRDFLAVELGWLRKHHPAFPATASSDSLNTFFAEHFSPAPEVAAAPTPASPGVSHSLRVELM